MTNPGLILRASLCPLWIPEVICGGYFGSREEDSFLRREEKAGIGPICGECKARLSAGGEEKDGYSNSRTQSCGDPCKRSGGFRTFLWRDPGPAADSPSCLQLSRRLVCPGKPGTASDRRSRSHPGHTPS